MSEIIIDGVNVAGCPHRKKEVTFMNVIKCYNHGACEGVNCLYKQLKRKEKECEELLKINEANANNYVNYRDVKTLEIERIKLKLQKLSEYVRKNAGLYFDEICTEELLEIIEGE